MSAALSALLFAVSFSADYKDPGPTVAYGETYGCYVVAVRCGDSSPSCEVTVGPECAATLEECLTAVFIRDIEDERGTPVLGCSPDAKRMDVDRKEAGL